MSDMKQKRKRITLGNVNLISRDMVLNSFVKIFLMQYVFHYLFFLCERVEGWVGVAMYGF